MPNPCQIHAKSLPNPCQSHAKSMPNPCQIHVKVVPKSCQSHAKSMPNPCQIHAKSMLILLEVRCRTPLPIIVTSQSFAKPNPTVQRMTSKKIFASPIICYNQYRSLSISQKSVINIDKDGCQLRRRSAMGRRSSSYCQES